MAKARGALAKRHMEGLGEGSLAGTLSRLLQLTSDAVLAFDGDGRVLLANDEAIDVLGAKGVDIAGLKVQDFFPDLGGAHASGAGRPDEPLAGVPFSLDGSATPVRARSLDGELVEMTVRCESVQAPERRTCSSRTRRASTPPRCASATARSRTSAARTGVSRAR